MSRKSKKINVASHSSKRHLSRKNAFYARAADSGSAIDRLWLYRFVYKSRKLSAVLSCLILSFVLQPFDVAAEESEILEPTTEISEEVVESLSELPTTEVAGSVPFEEIEEDVLLEEIEGSAGEETVEMIEDLEVNEEDSLDLLVDGFDYSTTTESTSEEDLEDNASSTEEIDQEEVATSTDSTSNTSSSGSSASGSESGESATSTESDDGSEESGRSDVENEFASSSEEMADGESEEILDGNISDPNLVSIIQSDSSFTFSRDECTRVESGSYYCQERTYTDIPNDALSALPDVDGDLEIYLTRDGKQSQVTSNEYDDASPYFDEYSNTIVWHRLIDDRHQIISYDVESGEETQITDTAENNMEPARHGDFTVWQRWLDNNWEIILFDGRREFRVTESSEHDIAPHIRGSLIIWNTQLHSGEHQLNTFDVEANSYSTIKDSDGVAVGNPRMVVMYEALYENGDIVTKGFDLISGKVVSLDTLPRSLPEEIPESDTTGETRALIQSKPSLKEEIITTVIENDPGIDTDEDTLDLTISATTEEIIVDDIADEFTLVLPSASTSEEVLDETVAETDSTSTQT